MTDFLTRLIGRNLGQWPVVQPQITSLFAPSQTLAGMDEAPGDAVSSVASSPPVSVMDTPVNDPTPSFAPTAPAPAPDRPASIPSLFASSDRPTLPLTRLPRPIASLPANQPPPLDSVAPAQPAPVPLDSVVSAQPAPVPGGSVPASPAVVPLSEPIERSESPLESAMPITNLPGGNSQPNAPQVRLVPDIANPPAAASSQTVAPSSSLPAAQPVLAPSPANLATSSAEAAIAPLPPPQSAPAPATPERTGASTPSVPLGSAAEVQPRSNQPVPPRSAPSNELYQIQSTTPPFPSGQTLEVQSIRPAESGLTQQDLISEGSEVMAIGQNASASPLFVRPLGLPNQEPVMAASPQGPAAPGKSFPPAVAPLLPTVTPAPVVTAPIAPVPQSFRQGGSAAAPAVPTIHVTIGRIEVRAITSSSPPPSRARRTPTTPQLSLNDYLTSRDQTP